MYYHTVYGILGSDLVWADFLPIHTATFLPPTHAHVSGTAGGGKRE